MILSTCSLLFFLVSHHVGATKDYNETHESIGIQCKETEVFLNTAAYYKNSNYKDSFLVGRRDYAFDTNFWVEYGGVTGYNDFIQPYARVGYEFTYLDLTMTAHRSKGKVKPILAAQLRFPLNF